MIPITPWIERQFVFSTETGLFPAVLMRLRGTIDRLEALAPQLTDEELTWKPRIGWTIQEHIGHLGDLEMLHIARVNDFLAGATHLRPADMNNYRTKNSDHNRSAIEDLIEDFCIRRNQFIEKLESLDARTHAATAVHPRLLLPMRPADLAWFVAEHDDHHFAHIHALMHRRRPEGTGGTR